MISASEQPVAKILGDSFIHEVPPYQRPYAWGETEAEQLFQDICEAMDSSSDEPYFLGSIVLIKPLGELIGQVVDGQQRLTTLTILAAVLRDIASDPQEREALGAAVYIQPNPFMGQQEAIRLKPHHRDAAFFREAIQHPNATSAEHPPGQINGDAQKRMWDNACILRSLSREMRTEDRQKLVKFLLSRCVMVVVSTESKSAALRIFKVLNDRGLDLSNADVIKADVLSKFSDTEEMARRAERWRDIEIDLGRTEFETLLEALRFVREEGKNRRTLSEAYAERFRDVTVDAVKEFWDNELVRGQAIFSDLTDCNVERFPNELRASALNALDGLNLLPNKDWIPVGISAALKLGYSAQLVEVLINLEGLAWAMQLCRRYDTQRMNRYADALRALNGDWPSATAALELTNEEISEARSALNGPIYTAFPTRVVRAILERLDRLIAEQPVVWDGIKTVEHILPQNPSNDEWGDFVEVDRHRIVHTLGNLILLTKKKNSSASNYGFSRKKSVYFGLGSGTQRRATYASAQELAIIDEWTLESYAERHARHFDLLCRQWRLSI